MTNYLFFNQQDCSTITIPLCNKLLFQDWWMSTTYSQYYKTWNTIVGDWIYFYVYEELMKKLQTQRKQAAKIIILFLSAVLHELVLIFALKLFLPILFLLFFGLGIFLSLIRQFSDHPIFHVLFLYGHFLGFNILLCVYRMEYLARMNDIAPDATSINFFYPRLLTCDCFE